MAGTLLYRAYSAATRALLPVALRAERRKLAAHGIDAARVAEKAGHAALPRPPGRLFWFHAASVGESLSVLALIDALGRALPATQFLLTTGTATSARILAGRLPPRTTHQFAPLDAPGPVHRFLDHWRPDVFLLVESELWPHMLMLSDARSIPLALVNARMSEKSLGAWQRRPRSAAMLLGLFRLIVTQSEALAQALIALGAAPERTASGLDLKSLAAPLPVDGELQARSRAELGGRPVWLAASTHPGEEHIVLEAHRRLLDQHPDLCLILVPRHPERAEEILRIAADLIEPPARRSLGNPLSGTVYLADTLGELGTWYRLAPIAFIGGSLVPIGGHNPYEAAQADAAILAGPHVHNFADVYRSMTATNAVTPVRDPDDLSAAVAHWLADPDALKAARRAASAGITNRSGALDALVAQLIDTLDLGDKTS